MWEVELHRLDAQLALANADVSGAELRLRRGLEVARRSQEAKLLELRCAVSLARLWLREDRRKDALELVKPIYDGFTEGFQTSDLIQAKTLLTTLQARWADFRRTLIHPDFGPKMGF